MNKTKGAGSEVYFEEGIDWLPEAAILHWEMGKDLSMGVFEGKRKDFCVMQWATGVTAGSTSDGN